MENTEIFERLESKVRSYCRDFPVVFQKAAGHTLIDTNGTTYVDFLSGALPTEDRLLTLFNEHLSKGGLEQLAAVQVARHPEDFPVGITGKVLKRELRTKFATLLKQPRPTVT